MQLCRGIQTKHAQKHKDVWKTVTGQIVIVNPSLLTDQLTGTIRPRNFPLAFFVIDDQVLLSLH